MRLRRSVDLKLCALDEATGLWVKLCDACSSEVSCDDCIDLVAFLSLSPNRREAWKRALASYCSSSSVAKVSEFDALCFEPRSFRDAALYVKHMKQASSGFAGVAKRNGHWLQMFFCQLVGKSLRLPHVLTWSSSRKPPYYVGNPLTFVGDGAEARWPSHSSWLDYELEVALLVGKKIDSSSPELSDIEESIRDHGAFVLINDFSARDTQADELVSVNFGFVKSKSFCTSAAGQVVTADELWAPPNDRGRLLSQGLGCTVSVNGRVWGRGSTAEDRVCSLAEYCQFVALDEGLYPGELLGLGTVPNCAGIECGKRLAPGDQVTVECESLGRLTNVVGSRPSGSIDFKEYGVIRQASRVRSALKLLVMAFFVPPLSFVLLIAGALTALVWTGPPKDTHTSSSAAEQSGKLSSRRRRPQDKEQ